MRETWKRRVSIAGIGLTLGLVLVVATAAGPSNGTTGPTERETTEQRAYDDMGRSARGSREFPSLGTPAPTRAGQGGDGFVRGTASGGAYIPGLGTVSHASIDNNWARLRDQARTWSDAGTGSRS